MFLLKLVESHTFLFPFVLGAMACSLFGGFWALAMTIATVWLGFKLVSVLTANAVCKGGTYANA